MKHSLILGGLFAATFLAPVSAFAHEAPCPYCAMPITQDTPDQDNEVALKAGRKRIEYKCVYCALSEAQSDYTGDLSLSAPSEKKGEPIVLKRADGKWSALPATPFFVSSEPLKHKICNVQARAFTTKEAAQAYIDAHKDTLADAKPLTLDEMVKLTG